MARELWVVESLVAGEWRPLDSKPTEGDAERAADWFRKNYRAPKGYFTLWEAEWLPAPPVDPLLLKQIGTTMFVVVAQWDLTPVERAVLEGRFA